MTIAAAIQTPYSVLVPESKDTARWLERSLNKLPTGIRRHVQRQWQKLRNRDLSKEQDNSGLELWQRESRREAQANAFVRDFLAMIQDCPLSLSAPDHEICHYAEAQAQVFCELNHNRLTTGNIDQILKRLDKLGITVEAETEEGIRKRVADPHFWRRNIRKFITRKIESIGRQQLGLVHRHSQLYCTNDSVVRFLQQTARNQKTLEQVLAVNQYGQEFTLFELMEKSTANPKLRRAELMTRISGFEYIAVELGHAGEFITLTCPSRFHPRLARSGQRNPKFDGAAPDEAAQYLQQVWSRIQASLARAEIKIYGFRVAEPHHDGTPHWHGLFFMEKQHVARFRQIVARHACRENREELGLSYVLTQIEANALARIQQAKIRTYATDKKQIPSIATLQKKIKIEKSVWDNPPPHIWRDVSARIEFKAIDWRRGTAAGYIAKYIAKNIDGITNTGDSVGFDFETDGLNAKTTSIRVRAWSHVWGIRQFQQIGGAPVTVWRELRRLEYAQNNEEQNTLLSAAFAADKGDWAKFCLLMGGVNKRRKDQNLTLLKKTQEELNRYGEPRADSTLGVVEKETGFFKVTRDYQWQIKLNGRVLGGEAAPNGLVLGGEAAPWTCVNNSTFLTMPKDQKPSESIDWYEYDRKETPFIKECQLRKKHQQSEKIDTQSILKVAEENAIRLEHQSEVKIMIQNLEKMLGIERTGIGILDLNNEKRNEIIPPLARGLVYERKQLREGVKPFNRGILSDIRAQRDKKLNHGYSNYHPTLEEAITTAMQEVQRMDDALQDYLDREGF